MDIRQHKFSAVSKRNQDRWDDKCRAFAQLRSGERHNALMSLVWAGYNAGYSDAQALYNKVYDAYAATGDTPDETDIEHTVQAVLRRAGEMTGGQAKYACGHTRRVDNARLEKIKADHQEYWQAWIDGIVKPAYEVPVVDWQDGKAPDEGELARMSLETMHALVGELGEGETVFCGSMYSDKHASSYIKRDWSPIGTYQRNYWCPNTLNGFERTNDNVTRVRYVLAEIDEPLCDTTAKPKTAEWMDEMLRQQMCLWDNLRQRLPIAAAIASGSKSIHVLLAVDGTREEFEGVRQRLVDAYAELHWDRACLDVARKSRTPYALRMFVVGDGGVLTDYDAVKHALDDCKKLGTKMQAAKALLAKAGLEYASDMSRYETTYRLQDVLYLDANVEHIRLSDLADKLEGIVADMLPDAAKSEFALAMRDKKDPGMGEANLMSFFRLRGLRIWHDEIAREDRCDGFPRPNPWDNVMWIRDEWKKLFGKFPAPNIIERAMADILAGNAVNPVADWLDGLTWDGTDHLAALYDTTGIRDEFSQLLVRKWLLQCVAIAHSGLDGGRKYALDGILTLVGKQGVGKTSFFRCLVPEDKRDDWMREGLSLNMDSKDSKLQAIKGWISELGEADSTTKREQSSFKAFMTNPTISERLPYARAERVMVKHASFCASVNKTDFLRDETGNRRWWPVNVSGMDISRMYATDPTQLWAQVMHEWRTGDDKAYMLTEAERAKLEARNSEKYVEQNEYESLLRDMYEFGQDASCCNAGKWESAAQIAAYLLPNCANPTQYSKRISAALRGMGMTSERRGGNYKYYMPPRVSSFQAVREAPSYVSYQRPEPAASAEPNPQPVDDGEAPF